MPGVFEKLRNLTPYTLMDSTNSQSKKGPQKVNVGLHEYP